MPDQTRRILNAVFEETNDNSVLPASDKAPQVTVLSPANSPKIFRRYSQAQDTPEDSIHESSVDNEAFLELFKRSAGGLKSHSTTCRLQRRRSSPDLTSFAYLNTQNTPTPSISESLSVVPENSILSKMVGSRKTFFSAFTQQQKPDSDSSPSVGLSSSHNDKENTDNSVNLKPMKSSPSSIATKTPHELSRCPCPKLSELDSTDSKPSSSSSMFLSKTRQFGAWLSGAVDGNSVEVTKKDVNVFAPTTF